jgi:putative transferase (TIGR04331 family)
MSRVLITTALEQTWYDDRPVLFLGEWCRSYSRRSRWSAMNAEVLPYHWNDRSTLLSDYEYLQGLHERLLHSLASQLNEIHDVDHGLRYWRILIGPWLGYFTQMLFDRWTSIQQAAAQYEPEETRIVCRQRALVPNGMSDFLPLFMGDDWNHQLYSELLQRFTEVPCVPAPAVEAQGIIAATAPRTSDTAGTSGAPWRKLLGALSKDTDAFLLATYLPWRDEILIHLRLQQLPQRWQSVRPPQVGADAGMRRWAVGGDSDTRFEACARLLIPEHIPTLYLEGYAQLIGQIRALPWPRRPKLIWTSNSEISDDVFKAWTAEKVEAGTPLVIGQHGGHYGTGRWSFVEKHEVAICDSYVSWGWSDEDQPQVKPTGMLTMPRPLGVVHGKKDKGLLVTVVHPRYSYWMYSTPVAGQWLSYFEDQFEFIERLPAHIRQSFTIRLYPQDYGWFQAERWRDRFPDLQLEEGKANLTDLIRTSRLYVSSYNATTYLESFAMDVPTVIYWNPDLWELRDSAVPYFSALKKAGIFHETPESAARHVAAIWENVDLWWSRQDVHEAVKLFTSRYCDCPPDLLSRIEGRLRDVVVEPRAVAVQ